MSDSEKVNLLVVDDQPAHLLSYEVILGDQGRNVVCARSGVEALQKLMEHDFAAILLDVNMPGMDGFELASLIHQHPRFEETPIIFVTAMHVTDLDKLKGYELGAIDYIYVPVIPSILRSKVDVLVELYLKRRELQRLNENLARANAELAQANSTLQAETARDLLRLNQTLEAANEGLARANDHLHAEVAERKRAEIELAATKDDLALQVEALTRIHELAMYLAGAQDLRGALQFVLRTVVEAHGAQHGFVALFDPETGAPHDSTSIGLAEHAVQDLVRIAAAPVARPDGLLGVAGRRVVVEDLEQDGSWAELREALQGIGLRAVHSTPIATRAGEQLGVISVQFDAPRRPTAREMQVADMCARYAAETIEAFKNQEVLRENEHRLREADRRKDEFLATLAHELRNPLAPIRNSLHILRLQGAGQGPSAQVLDIFERQVNQMVRLVDDLLKVSRITRGKIDLALEHVDLCAVLRAAVETSLPLIESAKHELKVSLPDEPLYVEADPVRMCQVFANLLNNAAKYTDPAGHVSLEVERQGDRVVVCVRDDGIGIPEDMLARVFDMFTQVDRTLGRAQGGLGIGLTLVKRLVEMHHGQVEARSPGLGGGSEFRVTLPLDRSPEALRPDARNPDRRAGIAGRRILLVDDNQDAAESLGMLLRAHGAEVRICHDGSQALANLMTFDAGVVLLDIGMPGMDGFEVAQRIRAEPRTRGVALIALTGWSHPEDRRRSSASGFDHHLVKPIEIGELTQVLRRLDHERAAVGAQEPAGARAGKR